jgi:hypothetical protein
MGEGRILTKEIILYILKTTVKTEEIKKKCKGNNQGGKREKRDTLHCGIHAIRDLTFQNSHEGA